MPLIKRSRPTEEAPTPARLRASIERADESREANLERIQKFLVNAADELRDLVIQTVAEDESLWDYVDRALPGADEDQRKVVYDRLLHERYEEVERLSAREEP
jgi:hypothetical protein